MRGTLQSRWSWAIAFAIAIGFVLRVAGSFKSFWLDEIWSYYLAQELGSVWDVIADRKHDNNHILNTLFIHLVGEREHWIWYRLLSIVTGTGTLACLAIVAARRNALEALTVTILAAASYPLILASGQSRGYAPAIFFSWVAWLAIESRIRRRSTASLALFWGACVLGILSHLTFIYAYLALLVGAALCPREAGESLAARVREVVLCHAVPLASIVSLYLVFYREIVVGGGPRDYVALDVVREAAASAVGFHGSSEPWLWTGAAVALAAIAVGVVVLVREGDRRWIVLLGAVAVVPGLFLWAIEPRLLYARYFVACVPFLYLLAAVALSALARRGSFGRAAFALVLAGYGLAQWSEYRAFQSVGRASYTDAMDYLDDHTDEPVVRVGSDHDFRNSLVLRFYSRYRESKKRFVYVERPRWSETGPMWYLAHSWLAGANPPPDIRVDGRSFTRAAAFDHGRGYGFTWFVYRNASLPPP